MATLSPLCAACTFVYNFELQKQRMTPEKHSFLNYFKFPIQNTLNRLCIRLKGEETLLISLADKLVEIFDHYERTPIKVGEKLKNKFVSILAHGETVEQRLSPFRSKGATKSLHQLQYRMLSLRMRTEVLKATPMNITFFGQLEELLGQWEKKQLQLPPSDHARRIQVLTDISSFPDFADLLINSPFIREECFKFVFLDLNPIGVFREFAGTTDVLKRTFLSKCVSRFRPELKLCLEYDTHNIRHLPLKIVTLPFEGRSICILDPKAQVTFMRGNWTRTIGEVFKDYQLQNDRTSDVGFFPGGGGFQNWRGDIYGHWDDNDQEYHLINIEEPNWRNQKPKILVSTKFVEERYGRHLEPDQATIVLSSTQETRDLNPDKAHGYTEATLPTDDPNVREFDAYGKYSSEYPKDMFQMVAKIGKTVRGLFLNPDPNIFYSHRLRTHLPVVCDKKKGEQYLDSFKEEIRAARSGDMVFSSPENCAYDVQEKAKKHFGNAIPDKVFDVPVLNGEAPVIRHVFSLIKLFPKTWQSTITKGFFRLLAPGRTLEVEEGGRKVRKSVDTHSWWNHPTLETCMPNGLWSRLKSGELKPVIYFGVRDELKRAEA